MAFNSMAFIVFLAVTSLLYWILPHRYRSWLLLAASYWFYASWRAEYLVLLVAMTLVNYIAGLALEREQAENRRKIYLALSLVGSFGLLFSFKYVGFAVESLNLAIGLLGLSLELPIPDILLPVGISFYTFQAVGYSIDVFRRERSAERHIGLFALFVSFFPQLVAGPIERSSHLLPQFREKLVFSYSRATDGLKLMAWGFFKKLVIADRVAIAVNHVYGHPTDYTGFPLLLATYLFAFQILCDFSAYTDIARGAARILGFDLMENFHRPYFATSIRDFWRRWHFSLTSWFRDYLYFPLGGNRVGTSRWFLNLAIVFLVSGLWHGAGKTFVIWGGLHAAFVIIGIVTRPLRERIISKIFGEHFSGTRKLFQMFVTFNLVSFAWIFFRANNIREAWYVVTHLFSGQRFSTSLGIGLGLYELGIAILAILAMLIVDLLQERGSVLVRVAAMPLAIRWAIYFALLFAILILGEFGYEEFIYFQF